jgi:hypothetical protein
MPVRELERGIAAPTHVEHGDECVRRTVSYLNLAREQSRAIKGPSTFRGLGVGQVAQQALPAQSGGDTLPKVEFVLASSGSGLAPLPLIEIAFAFLPFHQGLLLTDAEL